MDRNKLKLFLEKLHTYYSNITDQFRTSYLDEENTIKNKNLKEILFDIIFNQHLEKTYNEIPIPLTYFVRSFLNLDIKDEEYLDLYTKIIDLFGIPEEKVKKLTIEEIKLLFYNIGLIKRWRASVNDIMVLTNILRLENMVSIGELEIVYDKNKNDVYFFINYLTNPVDDLKYLDFDYVKEKIPNLMLTKEDILNNLDKFVFPYKTNILYIHGKRAIIEGLSEFLRAALFLTKFKNLKIEINLTPSIASKFDFNTKYYIFIQDIPLIIEYLLLKYFGSVYYIYDNKNSTYSKYISALELNTYLEQDYETFEYIVDLLQNGHKEYKYSELYDKKYGELRDLLNKYVYKNITKTNEENVPLEYVENYLLQQYPEFIGKIRNILQSSIYSDDDKASLLADIFYSIFISLLNSGYFLLHSNNENLKLYYDNVNSFINMFLNISEKFSVITNYIGDRISVILTQVPYYIIPFIDYTNIFYVISGLDEMVIMKSVVSQISLNTNIPDSALIRNKNLLEIENINKSRCMINSLKYLTDIYSQVNSKININEFIKTNIKSVVSSIYVNKSEKMNIKINNSNNDRMIIDDIVTESIISD